MKSALNFLQLKDESSQNNSGSRQSIDFSVDTEATFMITCSSFLLSDDIIEDRIISSSDICSFYEYLCGIQNIRHCKGTIIKFNTLNINIQLTFVWTICPVKGVPRDERERCLRKQMGQGDGNGEIIITTTNYEEVELKIRNFCFQIYPYSTEYIIDNPQPTSQPSESTVTGIFTPVPSTTISVSPPVSPSVSPSVSPLEQISQHPTEYIKTPTQKPQPVMSSIAPSLMYPHSTPSTTLSGSPSMSPSENVSQHPSEYIETSTQKPSPVMSSMAPSLMHPQNTLESRVAFTYMIKFYEVKDQREVLNRENTAFLNALEIGIIRILTSSSSGPIIMQSRQNHYLFSYQAHHHQQDPGITLTLNCDGGLGIVKHVVIQNYHCPEENYISSNPGSFSFIPSNMTAPLSHSRSSNNEPSKCILISSEIKVQYQEGMYTEREIETYVYLPIKISMVDETFQNQIGYNDIVKRAMYIENGIIDLPEEIAPTLAPSSRNAPGYNNSKTTYDAGLISVASVGWFVATILSSFFLCTWLRRRKWERRRREMIDDFVIFPDSSLEEIDNNERLEYDQIALVLEDSSNSLI